MNYTQTISGPMAPTANIVVNKSRIKVYKYDGSLPTYYLQKGQEFAIEIFNPSTDVILAKITLNGKSISQGGLVVNPGQRIFLDRYLDVAKKFLFDTYEIDSSDEAQKAIVQNGDFKVEFFEEQSLSYNATTTANGSITLGDNITLGNKFLSNRQCYSSGILRSYTTASSGYYGGVVNSSSNASIANSTNTNYVNTNSTLTTSLGTQPISNIVSKSVETGRVEKGSDSDQKISLVDKNFQFFPYHTIEYKLLPISQKINTSEDINIKRYCTNCGAKLSKGDKFCSSCGKKA